MKKVKIGLLGMGNIGTGSYKVLHMNHGHILETTGLDLEITKVLEVLVDRDRGIPIPKEIFTQDFEDILNDPEISIVIELLGGYEPATTYMEQCLEKGKHVVTANKAAVAANWERITAAAEKGGSLFRFEASVGGGIPCINAITTQLSANVITEVMGILNGTTNYILTKMGEEGKEYGEALKEAQEKGFAEADPTADVEGHDVANKLSILMSLCFGKRVHPDDIPTTGITDITKEDIADAESQGCVIKLIANGVRNGDEVTCFIQPTYINKNHPLAGVKNEFNALFLKGNAVDDVMMYGKGAGPFPTASAVLGDVIEVAKLV
ncbi:MAG: homoserine dehydrogenase [Clostridiales Family XIII bacterium]|jgi:homoserine dehydrogenase|nr:homoserine dehydrogenase [Clostridiales Family XIII bacterium]